MCHGSSLHHCPQRHILQWLLSEEPEVGAQSGDLSDATAESARFMLVLGPGSRVEVMASVGVGIGSEGGDIRTSWWTGCGGEGRVEPRGAQGSVSAEFCDSTFFFFPARTCYYCNEKQVKEAWTSLVAQWIRINEGTRVPSLILEDPTCGRVTN